MEILLNLIILLIVDLVLTEKQGLALDVKNLFRGKLLKLKETRFTKDVSNVTDATKIWIKPIILSKTILIVVPAMM